MGGFRLGRVLGLEIRIDYSWFIIFFLILWTFTMGAFPASYPGLSFGVYAAMGISATLLFFASILAHELSHSVVARSKGIPVEGITLFIFGGMAKTRMEFEDPADEFVIAGVGPLSSFVIAGLFAAAAWIGGRLGWSVAVTGVASHLAVINTALAVFNLLPGFPLDGGRLFRAVVWKATGNLQKAMRWATTGGKVVGYGLILLGLLQVFAGALIGGLWLVFIGWFMRTAAEASMTQHVLQRSLEGVRAADLMVPDPVTVPPGTTLQDFVDRHVLEGHHRGYPVAAEGRPLGLVTVRQVRGVPREEWPRRTVEEVMVPVERGIAVPADAPMADVVSRLGEETGGRLLVTREGRLEGILTRADLARWIERAQLLEG